MCGHFSYFEHQNIVGFYKILYYKIYIIVWLHKSFLSIMCKMQVVCLRFLSHCRPFLMMSCSNIENLCYNLPSWERTWGRGVFFCFSSFFFPVFCFRFILCSVRTWPALLWSSVWIGLFLYQDYVLSVLVVTVVKYSAIFLLY